MDLSERDPANLNRHPWELARSRFFRSLIARHTDVAALGTVLDVGAGDGWFAGELVGDAPPECRFVCWDVNYTADDLAEPPSPEGGVERVAEPPPGQFDLILLLDVIEHIDDDDAFLRTEIVPRLHDRSVIVVSVPAYQHLFSSHDTALGHRRRYRPRQLHELLEPLVDIVDHGGLFASLLVPRLVAATAERLGRATSTDGVGSWHGGPVLTSTVTRVLDADATGGHWLARHGVAVPGLSTWVVGRPRGATQP